MFRTASFLLLAAAAPASGAVIGQVQSTSGGTTAAADPAPLFASHDDLTITLTAPFKALFKDRSDEAKSQDAQLTYTLADGETGTLDIKVKLRGKTRKRKCRFPPIRLDFPKTKVEGTLFEGQNKLKLVAQCDPRRDDYQQYILLEFLVYRALNALTDMSFRVRMANITYLDSEGEQDPITNYGFIIEAEDAMAARNEWVSLQVPAVPPDFMDVPAMNIIEVFQYFIGHTDWSAFMPEPGASSCCHNSKVIGDPAGPVFPVPYDFDYTGVVNARYAEVSDQLPIRNVRDRIYRGLCMTNSQLPTTLQLFNVKQFEIYDFFETYPGLQDKQRERVIKYLDDFYDIINNEGQVERYFLRQCRDVG